MGKGFSKLSKGILSGGILLSIFMGVMAIREQYFSNGYELARNEISEEFYEEDLVAVWNEKKIPLTIKISPRKLSEKEAIEELERAKMLLDDLLKGENESLSQIETSLNFTEQIDGTRVYVEWTEKISEYLHEDGSFRSDVAIESPLEKEVSAILTCQEFSMDYKVRVTLMPKEKSEQKGLQDIVEQIDAETAEQPVLQLPAEYEGKSVIWKKRLDPTFLYLGMTVIMTFIFLRIGEKYDREAERRKRMEALERDYASVVSKFAMLLSAGLSVRNAWERIVRLDQGKPKEGHPVFDEMRWAVMEMQKGISEIEIYEKFGRRVGELHYKKLMSLFVSQKKRGSVQLIDAMNQEMFTAWEEQKRKVRQQGEKIGTKLLVPMMGMLAVVFVMVLAPAFLSF